MRFLTSMGFLEDIEPGHGGGARGGWQKAGQDPHGGGFAGAVRPQKADDLALLHLEGNVVHSDSAGVSLGQTLYFDHSLIPDKTNTVAIEGRAATRWMSV